MRCSDVMSTMRRRGFVCGGMASVGWAAMAVGASLSGGTVERTGEGGDYSKDWWFEGLPVRVRLNRSPSPRANLLVLPGWNHSALRWCSKTRLCVEARRRGFNAVLVDMQKSLYLKAPYPETSKELSRYPTRGWLVDTVWKGLIKEGVVDAKLKAFVMGLSTGGRGAVVLGMEHPRVFSGVATLSGDFSPEMSKGDRLMIQALGRFTDFPDRWRSDCDLMRRAHEMKLPIYIGHGKADRVVPSGQSEAFYQALLTVKSSAKVTAHFPERRNHSYEYWDSEVVSVLEFFESQL